MFTSTTRAESRARLCALSTGASVTAPLENVAALGAMRLRCRMATVIPSPPPSNCPRCQCGCAMRFARAIPKCGPLPELQVFYCPPCNEVETIETPPVSQMT